MNLLECVQNRHTLITLVNREHSLIKPTSRGAHTVSEDYLCSVQCNHYIQLTTIYFLFILSIFSWSHLLQSIPRNFPIYYFLYARIYSRVTTIFLLLPLCFYPLVHSIIVSIYLFYSRSAPWSFHPSVPPTPCALTALSLYSSSGSKAVTMMDY